MNIELLRTRLAEIMEKYSVEEQPNRIEALRETFPHSIRVKERPPRELFNCYAYALGIDRGVANFYEAYGVNYEKSLAGMFVQFLLQHDQVVEREGATRAGDLVLYFITGTPQHAGRVTTLDRVESKWGVGDIYEHSVWEVPLTYGDEIQFHEPLKPLEATDRFKTFCFELTKEQY